MLEESMPAIWASMSSWFTPTVFFVLLNIVIGTIAFSSSLASSTHHKRTAQDDNHPAAAAQNNLSRTSSVLHRLKSINLYRQKTDEIQPTTTFLDPGPAPAPPVEEHHFGRSVSDSAAAEQPPKEEPTKMKKWASSKSAFMEPSREEKEKEKEKEITGVRRPATMRAGRVVDESVDAKADDFINKFRNELKLQRLDSINRYKDMINRSAK